MKHTTECSVCGGGTGQIKACDCAIHEEKERADFEAKADRVGYSIVRDGDTYLALDTEQLWFFWQAGRAALRAESEPVLVEPVGEVRMRKGEWIAHFYAKAKAGKIDCGDKLYLSPPTAEQTAADVWRRLEELDDGTVGWVYYDTPIKGGRPLIELPILTGE